MLERQIEKQASAWSGIAGRNRGPRLGARRSAPWRPWRRPSDACEKCSEETGRGRWSARERAVRCLLPSIAVARRRLRDDTCEAAIRTSESNASSFPNQASRNSLESSSPGSPNQNAKTSEYPVMGRHPTDTRPNDARPAPNPAHDQFFRLVDQLVLGDPGHHGAQPFAHLLDRVLGGQRAHGLEARLPNPVFQHPFAGRTCRTGYRPGSGASPPERQSVTIREPRV